MENIIAILNVKFKDKETENTERMKYKLNYNGKEKVLRKKIELAKTIVEEKPKKLKGLSIVGAMYNTLKKHVELDDVNIQRINPNRDFTIGGTSVELVNKVIFKNLLIEIELDW